MMSAVWAGGSKSAADTSMTAGAGQNANSAATGAPAGQGANGNGTGNGSAQDGSAANLGSNGKNQALKRKEARAARHADIDKVRQQALDSLRAAFAGREASEAAGSSEIVNEKIQSEARAKGPTK
jgi:hypothetical protein